MNTSSTTAIGEQQAVAHIAYTPDASDVCGRASRSHPHVTTSRSLLPQSESLLPSVMTLPGQHVTAATHHLDAVITSSVGFVDVLSAAVLTPYLRTASIFRAQTSHGDGVFYPSASNYVAHRRRRSRSHARTPYWRWLRRHKLVPLLTNNADCHRRRQRRTHYRSQHRRRSGHDGHIFLAFSENGTYTPPFLPDDEVLPVGVVSELRCDGFTQHISGLHLHLRATWEEAQQSLATAAMSWQFDGLGLKVGDGGWTYQIVTGGNRIRS